ncbi:hypothetical protein ACQ4LE_005504 [Meloidogyne hapla]
MIAINIPFFLLILINILKITNSYFPSLVSDARNHLIKICQIQKTIESVMDHKTFYCDDAVYVATGAVETSCKRMVSRAAGHIHCDKLIHVSTVERSCKINLKHDM